MSASLRKDLSYSSLRAWLLQGCAHGRVTLFYSCLRAWHLMGCADGRAGVQVEKYRLQLELLREGRLVEAMAVRTGGTKATNKAVKSMEDGEGEHLPPSTSHVPPSHVLASSIMNSSVAFLTCPRMTSCEGRRT